jgi:gliding motility-associated-like protein
MRFFLISIIFIISLDGFSQLSAGFIAGETIGCDTITINFTDTTNPIGITSRTWYFGDGSTDTSATTSHFYNQQGFFTVKLIVTTLTEADSVEKTITIRKKPEAIFELSKYANYSINDTLFFTYTKITHTSNSITDSLLNTYTWILANDTLPDTSKVIVKQYPSAGNYECRLIILAYTGCSDTATLNLEIKNDIIIPNIFTPNGDGKNDIFYAQTDGLTSYELTIFSRYGSIVFTTTAQKVMWDGRNSAGEEVTVGTYYYILKTVNSETEKLEKGIVFLSR